MLRATNTLVTNRRGKIEPGAAAERHGCTDQPLAQLCRTLRPLLTRLAHSIARDREEAEDIVQIVFLRMLEHSPRVAGVPISKAFLVTAVKRAAIDRWRRTRAQRVKVEPSIRVEELGAAPVAPAELAEDSMLAAIDTLPDCLRTTLLLRIDARLSYTEIARRLNIPERTVATRIHRAKAVLRSQLRSRTDDRFPGRNIESLRRSR